MVYFAGRWDESCKQFRSSNLLSSPHMSTSGSIINAAIDLSDGNKSYARVGGEFGVSFAFGELGDQGVKATRRVAGEKAVKKGANKVSEAIIEGTIKTGEGVFNKFVTPRIIPSEPSPFIGPVIPDNEID